MNDKKKFWRVDCLMCETTLDIEAVIVFSTDQAAGFIKEPKFICGKCSSVCTVELREEGE